MQQLVTLFSRKKQQLQQALQLAGALYKAVNMHDLLHMVEQNKKGVSAQIPQAEEKQKKGNQDKGESSKMSLDLFKQGRSIADIAAERGMVESTIEGHLAGFVTTGEVDVLDLVDNHLLDKITALLAEEPDISLLAIKERSGNNVSYGSLKAIINYRERLKREVF